MTEKITDVAGQHSARGCRCDRCAKRRAAKRDAAARYRARNPEKVRERARRESLRRYHDLSDGERTVMKQKFKEWHLRRKYGLSIAQLEAMIADQGGRCAICRSSFSARRWGGGRDAAHVDHCHETGRVRGIICAVCNRGLGLLGDTEQSLQQALGYLRGPSTADGLSAGLLF